MNPTPEATPINLLLSHEELLYVLQLLGVAAIPGLDDELQGELSAETKAFAMRAAERALQARVLANVRADGQVVLHNGLISAVGACAFPQKSLFVYHWPVAGGEAYRYFSHLRGDEVIVHTRPAEGLHLFSRLPSPTYYFEQLLNVCEFTANSAESTTMKLSNQQFTRVRQLAESGSTQVALEVLRGAQAEAQGAQALVATLAQTPKVSILQLRKQQSGTVAAQDFTLIQDGEHGWLVQSEGGNGARALRIEGITRGALAERVRGWLN